MDKLTKPGRIIFAVGIIALGILCIISKDFIVGRPPAWPAGFDVNPALAYISAAALIIAAIFILFEKREVFAALLIGVLILLLSVLRHLPNFMNDWPNGYKSIALFGGSLIVAGSFFQEESSNVAGAGTNNSLRKALILTGCVLLAVFLIVCGYAHFKFAAFVKDFIPVYIPFHSFWTYFCGVCLFAGGVGLLIPQTRRWAAFLSGIMIAGWFILLHLPKFIMDINNVSDRMGLCESFTFVGVFFVLTGIFSRNK